MLKDNVNRSSVLSIWLFERNFQENCLNRVVNQKQIVIFKCVTCKVCDRYPSIQALRQDDKINFSYRNNHFTE